MIRNLILSLLMAASVSTLASETDSVGDALYDLSVEIEGKKERKGNEQDKETPEIDKYLKGEKGYDLYRDMPEQGVKKGEFESSLRKIGIVDTARAFGAQAGLHWRYKEINEIVEKYSGRLDSVNFRPFMTDGMVLTPSILIVSDSEEFLNDKKMIKTNISFVVADEARIVSVPPTYRDYLVREYEKPKPVNPLLRPKTEQEVQVWRKALKEGWDLGVSEAFEIFNDGRLKMERDIQGRVNYRKMVQLGMISPAALKVTKHGVTFNGRTMHVGESIYEITQDATFKTMDEWRSAWLKASRKE